MWSDEKWERSLIEAMEMETEMEMECGATRSGSTRSSRSVPTFATAPRRRHTTRAPHRPHLFLKSSWFTTETCLPLAPHPTASHPIPSHRIASHRIACLTQAAVHRDELSATAPPSSLRENDREATTNHHHPHRRADDAGDDADASADGDAAAADDDDDAAGAADEAGRGAAGPDLSDLVERSARACDDAASSSLDV